MSKNVLMVFVKNAIPGTAKTRIGRVKGNDVAMKIYLKLLTYTRDTIQGLSSIRKVVLFNKHIETDGIWSSDVFSRRMQITGDLGEKMEAAFRQEFEAGAQKVVIIGSDCADLEDVDIQDAYARLDQNDVVLGPAEDGGYYLLGMTSMHDFLFRDMPWSTEELLPQTCSRISEKDLTYSLLTVKSDIDYWEDWVKLGWSLD